MRSPQRCCFLVASIVVNFGLVYGQSGLVASKGAPSSSVEIVVRLVNSNTAEPMNGKPIVVYLGRDKSSHLPEVFTNKQGRAAIELPPGTEWITVAESSQTVWHCSPFEKSTFATSDILEYGVVAVNTCDRKGKLKGKLTAKPGEVIVFVRPLRFPEQ